MPPSIWRNNIRARRRAFALAILALLVAGYTLLALTTHRDTLWRIVSAQCVPDQTQHRDPAPCAKVDLAQGFAVLKDINGKTQYLLIPTARVTGIEDPSLQRPDAPDYWGAAWEARHFVEQRLGHSIPRNDIAMAVNSPTGRSQDQLHIHIDCLRADVRDALQVHMAEIGKDWSLLSVPLNGHTYHARRVDQADLAGVMPFRLVPDGGVSDTLVAAGVDLPGGAPGFVLLYDEANRQTHDRASGAQLLDHSCAGVSRS